MKALIITGYTLFSILFFLPCLSHCISEGYKEIRLLDVIAFILLLPGALIDCTIIFIIFIIDQVTQTKVSYLIKKILRKKVFK